MSSRSATSDRAPGGRSGHDKQESFPKSGRLLKRSDFQKAYADGRRIYGPLFTAFCFDRKEGGLGRVGLTVSRKVGGAVVRNRVKRLLREAVRRNWDAFPDGLDVVFHARAAAAADAEAVQSEVRRALQNAARGGARPA